MSDSPDWLELLRGLDESVQLGQVRGAYVPDGFDLKETQVRFGVLAQRLSDIYGTRLTEPAGPVQDASLFGIITIPDSTSSTCNRATGFKFGIDVLVSSFGGLATVRVSRSAKEGEPYILPPMHPDDRGRIDEVLTELGYRVVPDEVLGLPYAGPNAWVFGSRTATWNTRFFSWL